MKLNKIYVLGNILLEKDSLPIKLLPKLKKEFEEIKFNNLDISEEFPEEDNLVLIDTIISITEIKVLNENDLDKIELSPGYSLHDFDLAMSLKLAKKLGKIKKFTIIGLPPNIKEEHAIKDLRKIIKSLQTIQK